MAADWFRFLGFTMPYGVNVAGEIFIHIAAIVFLLPAVFALAWCQVLLSGQNTSLVELYLRMSRLG